MAIVTVRELQALSPAHEGQRVSMGNSMYGSVRTDRDGSVSVYVVWRYKFAGRLRQIALGTWKEKRGQSLKALRDERNALAAILKAGADPIEVKAAERLKNQADQLLALQTQYDRLEEIADKQARLTVRSLFEQWQALSLKQRKDGGTEAKRAFERDVFPLIGDVAIVDVTRSHIQAVVDQMMERNVVRMTKRVLSDLRQMFGFALDRELLESDPTARIKKAKIGPDGERSRVLSENELVALLEVLPKSGLAATSQLALLIQLSTVARIGEVVSAKWEHVDFARKVWVLPNTKNGRPHQIWLSEFALQQLTTLHSLTGATGWVFPNASLNGPLGSKTITKQVADRQRDGEPMANRTKQTGALKLPGGQWRPHDLRRTGASLMAEMNVSPEVIERCLNHIEENKMKRIYQRATYESQMRDAWSIWGERLNQLDRSRSATTSSAGLMRHR